jgi:Rod binding domain-containing protein
MKINNNSTEKLSIDTRKYKNLPKSAESKISRDIKLKAQAQEMEAIFLSRMIKAMEKTIPKSEESSSNSLSSMMFSSEMGSTMAKNGGIGLAKFIYNALKDKEVDLGEELSKLNNDSNLDKVQIMNLEKKVY